MRDFKIFKKRKKIYSTRGMDYFIIVDKTSIQLQREKIQEYSEIYAEDKVKHEFLICKATNKQGITDFIVALPNELGIYHIVNLFAWISEKNPEYNMLIGNNSKNVEKSFFAKIDIDNECRDTMIGRTNEGYQLEVYLPDADREDVINITDRGYYCSAVDLELQERGYGSLDDFVSKLEITDTYKFYI